MAKLSTSELLDAFKELSLVELTEFVAQFEETFGVTAAAPVAVAAAAPAAGDGGGAASEQDEFDAEWDFHHGHGGVEQAHVDNLTLAGSVAMA